MKTHSVARSLTAPSLNSYFYVYLFALLWALAYMVYTPPTALLLLSPIGIDLWMGITIGAAIIGMVGILMENNLLIERLGVSILASTPLLYALLQIGVVAYEWATPGADVDLGIRINSLFSGLWLFYLLFWRQQDLTTKVRLARRIPTKRED